MANTTATADRFVSRPSRMPRTADTVPLHLLTAEEELQLLERMDEEQRRDIGYRITQLRERSPWTQPEVASKLGIGLRAYQKLEKNGTTRYERCQELAEIHIEWAAKSPDWRHLSADWIWDGRAPQGAAPDLMESLNGDRSQLDRIEEKLDQLLAIAGGGDAAEEVARAVEEAAEEHVRQRGGRAETPAASEASAEGGEPSGRQAP